MDESSSLISDKEGEPLFDGEGKVSSTVAEVVEFLEKVHHHRELAQQAVNLLDEAGLIVEWPIKVKTGDKEEFQVNGLFRLDENKLVRLADPDFVKLRKAPALPVGYGQVFSMLNIGLLERLAKLREKGGKTPPKKANKPRATSEMDIDKLFDEDGLIRFDQ